jgi:hypothetical protein
MANIKDSGERTFFSSGACRDMHAGKGRYDLLPWHAIDEVAKHCEEGALKYGERNVDRGIDQHSLFDSAIRHMRKYLHNETDEPHLRAAAWNILWALEQETTHPELNDLPWRNEEESTDDYCSALLGCNIHKAKEIMGAAKAIEEKPTNNDQTNDAYERGYKAGLLDGVKKAAAAIGADCKVVNLGD